MTQLEKKGTQWIAHTYVTSFDLQTIVRGRVPM